VGLMFGVRNVEARGSQTESRFLLTMLSLQQLKPYLLIG
jgi:hypothetical protein